LYGSMLLPPNEKITNVVILIFPLENREQVNPLHYVNFR
jgi:hypothetical protein